MFVLLFQQIKHEKAHSAGLICNICQRKFSSDTKMKIHKCRGIISSSSTKPTVSAAKSTTIKNQGNDDNAVEKEVDEKQPTEGERSTEGASIDAEACKEVEQQNMANDDDAGFVVEISTKDPPTPATPSVTAIIDVDPPPHNEL